MGAALGQLADQGSTWDWMILAVERFPGLAHKIDIGITQF